MTDAERWLKSFQHCRTWCHFTNKSTLPHFQNVQQTR